MGENGVFGIVMGTALLMAVCPGSLRLVAEECVTKPDENGLQVDLCFTFGPSGAQRPAVFIAGDKLTASVRLSGLAKDSDGLVNYTGQAKVVLPDGTPLLSFPECVFHGEFALGGNSIMGPTTVDIPVDFSPGRYQLHIEVKDSVADRETIADLPFEVVSGSTFGALGLRLCHDREGNYPAGGIMVVGQCAYLVFLLNGCAIADDRVDVVAKLTALDQAGRPIGSRPGIVPLAMEVSPAPQQGAHHQSTVNFGIPVNRAGQFVLRLELEDQQTGVKASYDIPVTAAAVSEGALLR